MDFERIRAIQSPVERFKAVEESLPQVRRELFIIRRDAVREMRATMSHREVAEALGVPFARVRQLESDSGTGEEYRPPKPEKAKS